MEGPDDRRSEPERLRLQVDVLGRMARLDMDVACRSLAVFAFGALVDGAQNEDRRGLGNPVLAESGSRDTNSHVAFGNENELMPARLVVVHARFESYHRACDEVDLERVKRAGRRSRSHSVWMRDPLGRPEKLRNGG